MLWRRQTDTASNVVAHFFLTVYHDVRQAILHRVSSRFLCARGKDPLRGECPCIRSLATAMGEHQGGNGKENQAEGARNHTAESFEKAMENSHDSVRASPMVIVSSHNCDTFLPRGKVTVMFSPQFINTSNTFLPADLTLLLPGECVLLKTPVTRPSPHAFRRITLSRFAPFRRVNHVFVGSECLLREIT